MKTITLKVKIQVPDYYELDNSDWLLEDAISGKFEYSSCTYEEE